MENKKSNVVWTKSEDEIIKKYYPVEGKKVFLRLQNRTENSVIARACKLKVKMIRTSWTKDEDEILKKFYPVEGGRAAKRLPGHSKESCSGRAYVLGIKSEAKWSDEEIEILKKYYPKEGWNVAKRLPKRKKATCKSKANLLGLTVQGFDKWTDEEIQILKKYYPLEGRRVSKRLVNRNPDTCQSKAYTLHLSSHGFRSRSIWTGEEIKILEKYYPKLGAKCIKFLPQKSKVQITNKAYQKCIRKNPPLDKRTGKFATDFEKIEQHEDWQLCYWIHNDAVKTAFVKMINDVDFVFMAVDSASNPDNTPNTVNGLLKTKWYRYLKNTDDSYVEIDEDEAQMLLDTRTNWIKEKNV